MQLISDPLGCPISRRGLSHVPLNVAKGAALGLGVGLALVAFGTCRAGIALLGGAEIEAITDEDQRLLISYVSSFAIAGALIGALWPYLSGQISRYAAFSVGGMVVVLGIVLNDKRSLAAIDGTDWGFICIFGALAGSALYFGFSRAKSDGAA